MTDFFSSSLSRRIKAELATLLERANPQDATDRDPQAATMLIVYFCESGKMGKEIAPELMAYIYTALEEGLAGGSDDAWKALGLVRKKAGNPNPGRLTEGAREELIQEIRRLLEDGRTDYYIKNVLSALFGISKDTVRGYIRERKAQSNAESNKADHLGDGGPLEDYGAGLPLEK